MDSMVHTRKIYHINDKKPNENQISLKTVSSATLNYAEQVHKKNRAALLEQPDTFYF